MRMRGNSSPIVAMIERSPLWPPCPPLGRMRSFPNGRSMSSLTTSTPAGGVRYHDEIKRTGVPERFMNVSGFDEDDAARRHRAPAARRLFSSTS